MTAELNNTDQAVIDSTGNVFADLGLPHTEKDMIKVVFARAITDTITRKKYTQVEAAKIINVDQSKVSALVRGKLKGFSIERLLVFLFLLGRDINISIGDESEGRVGRANITYACGGR